MEFSDSDLVFDNKYLDLCFKSASLALTEGEVPIGAVFVKKGKVIEQTRNAVNAKGNLELRIRLN